MNRNYLLLLLCLFFNLPGVQAQQFFTETYQYETKWKVDHFKADEGKLQNLISSHTFSFRNQALAYAKTLEKTPSGATSPLVATEVEKSSLWEVKNSWTQEWEEKYAEWISKNLDVDFFVRNNLRSDCADVAYVMRWIFSRNNQLPVGGTLAGTGTLITHEVMKAEWLALPTHESWEKDQRFIAALIWVLDNVYTKTLYIDTYPVALRKETIAPGLIFLTGEGRHTEVFNKISNNPEESPLEVVSSSLPVKVRKLSRRIFMESSSTQQELGGLVQFRWPVRKNGNWELIKKNEMPFYSLEQYLISPCGGTKGLSACMMERLGITFEPRLIVEKLIEGLHAKIIERIALVKEGHEYCLVNDCTLGSQGYEEFGTPSRDQRILDNFITFSKLSGELDYGEFFAFWESETSIPGLTPAITIKEFRDRLSKGFVSSDPRTSPGARWALGPEFIAESVGKRLADLNIHREDLIGLASSCRASPEECQNSVSSYAELSTHELDQEQRTLYLNWKEYCDLIKYRMGLEHEAKFQKLWRQSPAPWDSLVERRGSAVRGQETGHIINATSVEQATERYLILDDKRLYDIESRSFIDLGKNIHEIKFDSAARLFVGFSKKSVHIWGEKLDVVSKYEIPIKPGNFYWTHSFRNGKMAFWWLDPACDCSTDFVGKIIDLKTSIIIKDFKSKSIRGESENGDALIISGKSGVTLLAPEGRELIQTQIPSMSDEISWFFLLNPRSILATGLSSSVGIFSNGKWKELSQPGWSSLRKLNSNFYLIQLDPFSTAKSRYFIVNQDGEIRLQGQTFQPFLFPDSETRLGYDMVGKEIVGTYVIEKDKISKIELGPSDFLVSTWASVYSVIPKLGGPSVYTYSRDVVETSERFVKSNCNSTRLYGKCVDETQVLLMEYYLNPVDSSKKSYSRIGPGADLNMTETYAYLLENRAIDRQLYEFYYLNREIKTGQFIRLSDSYLLWYPIR